MSAEAARLTRARSRPTGWWGMVGFIATEATLFSMLFFTYFFVRSRAPTWPPPGIADPKLTLIWPMTALLLGSTFPIVLADVGIRRGKQWALKLGLGLTIAMGGAFLGLTGIEWHEKVREFLPTTNAYGSLYYTIVGTHALHVFTGLILLLYLQVRAWLGHFDEENHLPVQVISMYWHFVDVVWIVVVSVIYLMPHVT
jgi:cytochrome c oxidase subunit III